MPPPPQAPLPPWAEAVLSSGHQGPSGDSAGPAAGSEAASSRGGGGAGESAAGRAADEILRQATEADGAVHHWPEGLWADIPQDVLTKYGKLLADDDRQGGGGGGGKS